jgi:hypothetical protein
MNSSADLIGRSINRRADRNLKRDRSFMNNHIGELCQGDQNCTVNIVSAARSIFVPSCDSDFPNDGTKPVERIFTPMSNQFLCIFGKLIVSVKQNLHCLVPFVSAISGYSQETPTTEKQPLFIKTTSVDRNYGPKVHSVRMGFLDFDPGWDLSDFQLRPIL